MFVISRKPTWQNRDALAREDGLRRRRGGPVGALADELGLDAMRVVAVDRALHRCMCEAPVLLHDIDQTRDTSVAVAVDRGRRCSGHACMCHSMHA